MTRGLALMQVTALALAGGLAAGGGLRAGPTTRPATGPAAASKPAPPTARELAGARAVFERLLKPLVLTDADRKRIEGLIADLGSDRWKVREAVTKALSEAGPEAIGLVEKAIASDDLEVATRASAALKAIRDRLEGVGTELNPAIDVLVAGRDKDAVGMLIRLLKHVNPSVRYSAEYGLRRVTGKAFGYNAHADAKDRKAAAEKWQAWWKANAATFAFGRGAASRPAVGLLVSTMSTRELVAMTLDGKVAWKRTLRTVVYAIDGLINGNVLVGFTDGCVEEYDARGKKVWSNENLKFKGRGGGGVYGVQRLANGSTLIVHGNANEVREVTRAGKEVWSWTGRLPISARRLPNGNTLIAEYSANRVVEVDRFGKVVWQKAGVTHPCEAVKLPNGNVLIGEGGGALRALEINRAGRIVWQRACPKRPVSVCRLPDGNTVIANATEGVIVVGRDGKTVRQLLKTRDSWIRVRLVAAAVLRQRKGAPDARTRPAPRGLDLLRDRD